MTVDASVWGGTSATARPIPSVASTVWVTAPVSASVVPMHGPETMNSARSSSFASRIMRVRSIADASAIDRTRIIREANDELLAEFIVSGPCIGTTLADTGAVTQTVEATDGIGRAVADVPPHTDASTVIETVGRQHDADLVARRDRDRAAPAFTCREFRAALTDRLTDRQLEAIRTAYAGGYFSWPRESSAEECAGALGITQPTFNQHLRAGQEKLVRALFDADPTSDSDGVAATTRSPLSQDRG